MAISWSKLESTFRESPKVYRLADRLEIDDALARGLLTGLWSWTQNHAADGDLRGLTPGEIERGAAWKGQRGELVKAMIETRFLDETPDGLVLHEFLERLGSYGKTLEKRAERARKKGSTRRAVADKSEKVADKSPTVADKSEKVADKSPTVADASANGRASVGDKRENVAPRREEKRREEKAAAAASEVVLDPEWEEQVRECRAARALAGGGGSGSNGYARSTSSDEPDGDPFPDGPAELEPAAGPATPDEVRARYELLCCPTFPPPGIIGPKNRVRIIEVDQPLAWWSDYFRQVMRQQYLRLEPSKYLFRWFLDPDNMAKVLSNDFEKIRPRLVTQPPSAPSRPPPPSKPPEQLSAAELERRRALGATNARAVLEQLGVGGLGKSKGV